MGKTIDVIEVKHVRDIIELWDTWVEHDSAFGAGHVSHRGTLYHIYESDDKIFRVNAKGVLEEMKNKEK